MNHEQKKKARHELAEDYKELGALVRSPGNLSKRAVQAIEADERATKREKPQRGADAGKKRR